MKYQAERILKALHKLEIFLPLTTICECHPGTWNIVSVGKEPWTETVLGYNMTKEEIVKIAEFLEEISSFKKSLRNSET